MSDLLLKKFGNELKELREEQSITIEQINTKTRIDKKYLNAIESGEFSILPEVYIRAFIKEYASAIQLNPSEILSKFEMAQKGLEYDQESESSIDEDKQDKNVEETIKKKISQAAKIDNKAEIKTGKTGTDKNIYYLLTAVMLFLSIFIIYKVFLVDSTNEIITEKPFEEIMNKEGNADTSNNVNNLKNIADQSYSKINPKSSEQVTNRNITDSQNKVRTNVIQTLKEGVLTLTLVGIGKSWIRAVSDSKDNTEFIIEDGVTKVLTAKDKFYLHIGNSGGVKMLLNNNDLLFRGSPGKVRKIFVTEDGIEYLKRTPILNEEN